MTEKTYVSTVLNAGDSSTPFYPPVRHVYGLAQTKVIGSDTPTLMQLQGRLTSNMQYTAIATFSDTDFKVVTICPDMRWVCIQNDDGASISTAVFTSNGQ